MTPHKLKEELLRLRTPKQWEFLISEVLAKPKLFEELIKLSFVRDQKLSFRASWVMDKSIEQHPQLLTLQYIEKIASKIVIHPNFSVIRSCLRLLSRSVLPIENLGLLTDQCFKWLAAISTPIAVKAHAMQILYHVTLVEPDFKNELKMLIEDQLPDGSAGFKSRGRRIIKLLDQNIPG